MNRYKQGASRRCVAAALFLVSIALLPAAAYAVECHLAPDGAITTWLVSPALPLDAQAGFAKDLLPEKEGETSGAARAEGAGTVLWRAESFRESVLDLSSRCVTRGAGGAPAESVFYAACELRAEKAGTYLLSFAYWAQIAAWLDGAPVVSGAAEDEFVVPRKSVEIKLAEGRTHRLLVKVASKRRQVFFKASLVTTGAEQEPAPVRCIIRVPDERAAALLLDSLELASKDGALVRADTPVPMVLQAPAGCPAVEGELSLKASIRLPQGRTIHEFKDAKMDAQGLPGKQLSLSWTPPKDPTEPKFLAQAEVRLNGKTIGSLEKTFYLVEGISAWMQGLNKRIHDCEAQMNPLERAGNPDLAFARLKLEKAMLHGRGDQFGMLLADKLVAELEECNAAVSRLEGRKQRPLPKGLSEHAYLCPIDDAPQPYYVFIPQKHDGRTFLPCIVYLHGYAPDLNKLNWEMIPRELLDYCDQYGYYLVAPFARSNTDFQAVGEVDVIRVLQLANERYPIDGDRIFLLGYSMGGMGVFTIGGHYPDLWAGLISISGRADYYLWKNLDKTRVEPYKRLLLDAEFGAEMAGNYRALPVIMYHGENDSLVEVEQSKRLAARLEQMRADVTLNIFPGQDHWIMGQVLQTDEVFKWMAKRKRNRWPAEVDFIAHTFRYREAYWVRVLDIVRWGEPIHVRARFNPDKTELTVKTANVASLRLDLAKELVGDAPNLTVIINDKKHKIEKAGPATFEVEAITPGKLRKSPRLCGPVKDAFNRRFLIVVGSGAGTPQDAERFKRELVAAASEWYLFTKSFPLLRSDTEVTPDDIAQSNLILFGKPSDNRVLKDIADKLPVKVTDDGFEFGGKKYPAADHGLVMIYPNPANPTRYVVVRSGLQYGGSLPNNHKYDLLPDFVIFTKGTDYDDTDKAVVAGFFDENWQVAERLIWRRGKDDPDPRIRKPTTLDWPESRAPKQ